MMSQSEPGMLLNNGTLMPRVGLGTFKSRGPELQTAIQAALHHRIRLIDTASIYKNENDIKEALADHQGMFITSKLSPHEHGNLRAQAGIDGILDRLGNVDLLLMHWPGVSKTPLSSAKNRQLRHETWTKMEHAYRSGRVRAIGVSNFSIAHLEDLLAVAEVYPAVNQVEVHPWYQQVELRNFCKQQGIAVTAYASLTCGRHLSNPDVLQIASSHHKTPAQARIADELDRAPKECLEKLEAVRSQYLTAAMYTARTRSS